MITKCLCCDSDKLHSILKLEDSPLTDNYFESKSESISAHRYPLAVNYCSDCTHVQLDQHVDPKESYSNYLYNSSITLGLNKNFTDYALQIKSFHNNPTQLRILDVGSNDGSFLHACQTEDFVAYGVEPAGNLAMAANSNNIPTNNAYFGSDLFKTQIYGNFPMITTSYLSITSWLICLHRLNLLCWRRPF